MELKIITADQRLQRTGIKALVAGPYKIGKTTLLLTLPEPEKVLFLDIEAGDLALGNWHGASIGSGDGRIREWRTLRDIACWIGGPNPSKMDGESYSQGHYDYVVSLFGGVAPTNYHTFFIDSLSVASRLCYQWAVRQPEAFTKEGKPNLIGAYGFLGKEMIEWATHIQHAIGKNIVFVCLLDQKIDNGITNYSLQLDGAMFPGALPGIVDQVISMMPLTDRGPEAYRALVCTSPNPYNVPAGDRSGTLDMVEPPHLGNLFEKIRAGKRKALPQTGLPPVPGAITTEAPSQPTQVTAASPTKSFM